MIVARLRETTVSSHEAARVVLQASEPPMALQPLGGSVVWDGFPAIRFRGADPTRLRIYFGEQLPRDVLMPATDRSPRCSGGSTSAMPRVFRNQFLSLVTLSFVPSPRQLTKRTDHFRYMIHGEKRVQNCRTSCSEYSHAAPRPSQSRTRGPERAARFTAGLKLDYGVPVPLTRGDAKAPTVPPCCERGGGRFYGIRWPSP